MTKLQEVRETMSIRADFELLKERLREAQEAEDFRGMLRIYGELGRLEERITGIEDSMLKRLFGESE